MLFTQPVSAIKVLWVGFWRTWPPSITLASFLMGFIFSPTLLGYGTSKLLFALAMTLIFIRALVAEEIHGDKKNRREPGTRFAAMAIILIVQFATTVLIWGALENSEKGQPATLHNIWIASSWWGRRRVALTPQAIPPIGQQQTLPTPALPLKEAEKPMTRAEFIALLKQYKSSAVPAQTQGKFANISDSRLADMLKSTIDQLLFYDQQWRDARRDIQRDLANEFISQEEAKTKSADLLIFWRAKSKDILLLACDLRTEVLSPSRPMLDKRDLLADKDGDALFARLASGKYDAGDVRPTIDYLQKVLSRFRFAHGM